MAVRARARRGGVVVIRNASNYHPHRVLGRMPSGALVQLRDGAVWERFVNRWMPAGWVIPVPLRPLALVGLNGGTAPVRLLPAGDLGVAA